MCSEKEEGDLPPGIGVKVAKAKIITAKGQIAKRLKSALEIDDEAAFQKAIQELEDLKNDPSFQADRKTARGE